VSTCAPGLPGSGSVTQGYTYDPLNRLTSIVLTSVVEGAPSASWSRNYYFDVYGNRAAQGNLVDVNIPQCANANDPSCTASDFLASNRLSATFAAYDKAGNQTHIKYPGNSTLDSTLTYNAANKQVEFCANTPTACDTLPAAAKTIYSYDGQDKRVKKVVNDSETTVYVYNAFGKLAAEYADVAPAGPAGTHYRTTDHLGSTRLVTNATQNVLSRRDFFPFGEKIPASATYGNRDQVPGYNQPSGYRQQFTGKERDDESKLDYFLARYYSAPMGRFLSVDPNNADATLGDPRAWNGYAYVRGNPLSLTDPDGRKVIHLGNEKQQERLQNRINKIGSDSPNDFTSEIKLQDEMKGLLVRFGKRGFKKNSQGSLGDADIYELPNGTIVVDINIDSFRTDDATIIHEVGHGKDARIRGYATIKAEEKANDKKGTLHDDRFAEKQANEFKKLVQKDIKETRKAKRQKQKEEKRRRKQESREEK